MIDLAVRVEDLSKSYRLAHRNTRHSYVTLQETLLSFPRQVGARLRRQDPAIPATTEAFWALRHIRLDVREGEVLGIIGRNGAGKSTLLKILSRITEPTSGRVEIYGRVGSLLEVGTGFHPELTGRENIDLNGAMLGMSRKEIRQQFDAIVDFAEVEQFLDTPVKRYSSGMYVRLAFAVAAHLSPEILIVDEVLAVGDAAFQKKCLGKMETAAKSGRTVLFVSHNMAAVEALCHRAILLEKGRIVEDGAVGPVIYRYLQDVETAAQASVALVSHAGRRAGSEALLEQVALCAGGHPSTTVKMGQTLTVTTTLRPGAAIPNMRFGISIEDRLGQRVLAFSPSLQAPDLFARRVTERTITCEIPNLRLLPGLYHVSLILGSGSGDLDRVDQAVSFTVESADVFGTGQAPAPGHGIYYQEAAWAIRP